MYKVDCALPGWVKTWVWFSSLICIYDGLFCVLRPHSLPGGSLETFFLIYRIYIQVDKGYANARDTFVLVQGMLNLVEYPINLAAVLLSSKQIRVSKAILTSLGLMGAWKTTLFGLYSYDLAAGGRELNSFWVEFGYMVLPQIIWIAFPGYIAYTFWQEFLELPGSLDKDGSDDSEENDAISDDTTMPRKRNYNLRNRKS